MTKIKFYFSKIKVVLLRTYTRPTRPYNIKKISWKFKEDCLKNVGEDRF